MRKFEIRTIAMLITLMILLSGCLSGGGEVGASAGEGDFAVTLLVRADALLDNLHLLEENKRGLIPEDGIFFAGAVRAEADESVFDVLHREMRGAGIHLAFRNTPLLDTVYVAAIGNLYEFDAGALSGWMFQVNGEFPGVGASGYLLSPGDQIEWVYTLDLGRDIGFDR